MQDQSYVENNFNSIFLFLFVGDLFQVEFHFLIIGAKDSKKCCFGFPFCFIILAVVWLNEYLCLFFWIFMEFLFIFHEFLHILHDLFFVLIPHFLNYLRKLT